MVVGIPVASAGSRVAALPVPDTLEGPEDSLVAEDSPVPEACLDIVLKEAFLAASDSLVGDSSVAVVVALVVPSVESVAAPVAVAAAVVAAAVVAAGAAPVWGAGPDIPKIAPAYHYV